MEKQTTRKTNEEKGITSQVETNIVKNEIEIEEANEKDEEEHPQSLGLGIGLSKQVNKPKPSLEYSQRHIFSSAVQFKTNNF